VLRAKIQFKIAYQYRAPPAGFKGASRLEGCQKAEGKVRGIDDGRRKGRKEGK